jgi:hypothetical protein
VRRSGEICFSNFCPVTRRQEENKFKNRGAFFATTQSTINSPQSTINQPQTHQQKTTRKRTTPLKIVLRTIISV